MRWFPLYLMLLLMASCQPKEATEAGLVSTGPDTLQLDETIDSANNTRQDGTQAPTALPEDPKQQLPPTLEVYLDQTHGLWQLPELRPKDITRLTQDQQGPYFLQTDLNQDNQLDYVAQLMERDSVFLYAFISTGPDEAFKEVLLDQRPLVKLDGEGISPWVLCLPQEQQTQDKSGKGTSAQATADGFLVLEDENTTLYQWRKGTFRKSPYKAAGF
ncbi:hypothetical protein GU926_04745 [Nibribacter ruber]|uniref:Lipoprotein n=1 Tax=Nibribacter ruber TaxID=2698458 RepID=A0A6P1NWU0_9BACT|nr:hypothetical protein [Nibribacter ruber]QHL86784.1 hypothetical protein GU926_04745 [Nibribacter ruber]